MRKLSILVLLISLATHPRASLALESINESREEAEIWALEADYVSCFRDAAHDRVIAMWHDRFLGWPASEARPADKDSVIHYLKRVAPLPGTWSFEIEKAGIRIHGQIAITHFMLHTKAHSASGTSYQRSIRVTHTWIKARSGWQILAGMSAAK